MGIISSIASLVGYDPMKKANKNATILQQQGMDESLGYLQPYDAAAKGGLQAYLDAIGQGNGQRAIDTFQNSPMYRLNFDAMMKAGENGVRSMGQQTGTARSGRTLMALQDNAQRVNNGMFKDYVSPLAGLTEAGVGIAGSKANIRTNGAANLAQGTLNKGAIKAGNIAGFDSLLNSGIGLMGAGLPGMGGIQTMSERFGLARSIY